MRNLANVILIFFISTVLIVLFVPSYVYGEGIIADGLFEDWEDKPFIEDTYYDESPSLDITLARWFVDTQEERLYLYCERMNARDKDEGKKFEDWEFVVYFKGAPGNTSARVFYHPPSNQVDIVLRDRYGRYLWSAKGKWGADKYPATEVEFYIPVEFIAGSMPGGYEFEMYFQSGKDRVPDKGKILVSSIGTYPWTTAGVLVVVVTGIMSLFLMKGGKRCLLRL